MKLTMKDIILTITKQVKKEGTKTVWETIKTSTTKVTSLEHERAVADDTLRFFRSLGGSESVTKNYTSRGYLVTKVVSTNPSKDKRTIREYSFD